MRIGRGGAAMKKIKGKPTLSLQCNGTGEGKRSIIIINNQFSGFKNITSA
jgi:hypothetical protein